MSAGLPAELRTSNWGFLLRRLTASAAHQAVTKKLEEALPGELRTVLRHHRDGSFSDPSQILFRSQMDRWLADAGMLYLGWLSGYVVDPGSAPGREPLLLVLGNPAVREYYEKNYPVAIPWLLRLHLEGNLELPAAASMDAAGAFERFSVLYERFQSDPDLLQFLDFLDGFWYGDPSTRVGIQAVIESFGVPDRVALAFGRRSDQATPLDRGIVGLVRFLAHSKDLDQLLTLMESLPLVQSGFWFFYAYWFREFQNDIAEASNQALDNAVTALKETERPAAADRISVFTAELDDWKQVMARLTGNQYSTAIPRAVASAIGAAHMVSPHEFTFADERGAREWLERFGAYEQAAVASPRERRRRRHPGTMEQELTPEEKLLRAIFEPIGSPLETPSATEADMREEDSEEEMGE